MGYCNRRKKWNDLEMNDELKLATWAREIELSAMQELLMQNTTKEILAFGFITRPSKTGGKLLKVNWHGVKVKNTGQIKVLI